MVIQTPKIKEKEKGTDWEWWIGCEELGWLRYAIQAKKIDPTSLNYKSLNYKSGTKPNKKRQIDILKKYAKENNAIALYSFYNYVEVRGRDDLHPYCHQRIEDYQIEQFGWTYTPIDNVLELLDSGAIGNKKFENIHSYEETLPMRYLMHPKGVKTLLQSYKNKEEYVPGYSESLPSFFKNIEQIVDKDNEEEMKKRDGGRSTSISYFIEAPEFSIFEKPRQFKNNVVIKNASVISEECYNRQLGLYPKRIVKIDIGR